MNTGEFLLYTSEDGMARLEVRLVDETVWLSQKQMADLFQKDVRTINEHILNLLDERELAADSVIRKFRITAADGKSNEVAQERSENPAAFSRRLPPALIGATEAQGQLNTGTDGPAVSR